MTYGATPGGTTPFGAEALDGETDQRAFTIGVLTTFGTPLAGFLQIGIATGTQFPTFGLANVYPGWVPGTFITVFGTPIGTQYWDAASFNVVTKISPAYFAFSQSETETGQQTTQFGSHGSFITDPPNRGRVCQAFSFHSTAFGTPNAAYARVQLVSGNLFLSLGLPSTQLIQAATGVQFPVFNIPITLLKQKVSSSFFTQFGTPSANIILIATGSLFAQRFGTPSSSRSNTYIVSNNGPTTHIGHPFAFNQFNYPVTGFIPVVFGTPNALESHRVVHIAPITSFGTPLLQRSTIC